MVVDPSCLLCGEAFEPRRRGGRPQKYCSPKCRKLAADRAWRDRNRPDRPTHCAECGNPIAEVGDGTVKIYCSDRCKARTHNRRSRRARMPLAQPAPKTCPQCGKDFIAKARNRIYCYDSWCSQLAYRARRAAGTVLVVERTAKCDGCGSDFTAKHPAARWCSKQCANRHWGLVRSRQRGQLSEAKYTDLEIFTRDNWTCHICKKKVRRDVDRLHPEGATIDHLTPISKGGPDEPANVATAHWKCNRDKRAGSANDQLALL